MDITITSKSARVLAERLRHKVGPEQLSVSKAYEALAHTLGHKNWDTLSGVLANEEIKPEPALRPGLKELFVLAFSCDENCDSPDWARVDLSTGFLERVFGLAKLCKDQGLEHVSVTDQPNYWHDPSHLNVRDESLYVSERSFWFRGHPKHCDYAVETRSVPLDDLRALLRTGQGTRYLALHGSAIVAHCYGDVEGFIVNIQDVDMFDNSSV